MKSLLLFSLSLIIVSCFSENARISWNFFMKNGLTKAGAAGLLGNLKAESGVRADIYEKKKHSKIGLSNAQYVKKVNDGTYKNFVKDGVRFGIAQWSHHERKQNLLNLCKGKIGDIRCQLEYLIKELKQNDSVWNVLTTSNNVRECSNEVLLNYEKPKNKTIENQNKRAGYSQKFYEELAYYQQEIPNYYEYNLLHSENWDPEPPKTYTIKKGDTLTSIADKFDVNINKLAELNNIRDAEAIKVGQVIIIP